MAAASVLEPDRSPFQQLDREIFDSEEEIAASGPLEPLLREWNTLVRAEVVSVQSYPVYDRVAQVQQRWHQCLVAVAAISGSVAVLLAVLQLATFARPELRNTAVVDVLSHSEYVAAILAVVAVVLGLTVAFHNRWRVLRMKAEQYRFLKFHYLLHAQKWLEQPAGERLEHLRTLLAGIHALDNADAHHWAQGVFSLYRDEPSVIAGTDAPLASALVAYFRDKRIGSQRKYFIAQTQKRFATERGTWFIPPACFFLSIVFAFVHFASEIGEDHNDPKKSETPAAVAKAPAPDSNAHRHNHPPSPLMIGCLIGAAAFPVLGAMIRTIRTAFEFGRNANRFEGVAHILDEIDKQLVAPLQPAAQMELLREGELVLQYENRSWMRLMIEAEWFGQDAGGADETLGRWSAVMCRLWMRFLACIVMVGGLLPSLAVGEEPTAEGPTAAPRWWKGNLHTHTLWSDGDDFPDMVADWYRERGYHFLALSDHNVLSQGMKWMKAEDIAKRGGGPGVLEKYRARFGNAWVETRGSEAEGTLEVRLKPFEEYRALVEERGRFLMIPAEEISDKAEGVPVHINASNLRDAVQPLGGATVREAITNNLRNVEEQAKQAGREILAHLNHPNFGYAITAEDLAHAVSEQFFEVYNGHPGVNQPGDEQRPSVERLWDIANTIRLAELDAPPLFGIATDDSHSYHGKPNAARPGRGWLMVRATHLTPEYLIKAIKVGDCYASSGVMLEEVKYDEASRALELTIQPQEGATFVTQFIGTLRGVDSAGTPVVDAEGQPPKDKAGKTLRVSRRYSDQVGAVLATAEGLSPRYVLTGKELYVRAVVASSLPPADPSYKDQKAQAWTQPVGWQAKRELNQAEASQ